ncbi:MULTISPECIES: hypothetical protein [unclassified Arcicella]|uniref:hypothetical protein n=1 Tax=unclassified Arcicella TaxID=2644986 RepID=UPI00285FFF76|nr:MULTISPECIES: hypothetical protein [unclassified Arcicella]MDR6562232.1 hypothetical protein [Arcicella sp. BE51]MDR6812074.1 hypothetical protein [Arcicella sp. BE140]MDR6823385.1 hypothetical protein [Arcicella sp. BE139]
MAKKIDFKTQMKSNVTQTVTSGLISNETIKQKIVILDELKNLIEPLQEEELQGLESNILANGCKDSLIIWQTTEKVINPEAITDTERFVLVDGHNRYKICTKHNISFNVMLMFFHSLQDVKNYMLDLQMGRRNLSQIQMAYYRGLRYNNEKITSKAENFSKDAGDEKTSQKIAKQFNVDEKTIRRDGEFAIGLEKLSPAFKKEVLAGKQKVSKKSVQQLTKVAVDNSIESIEDLEKVLSKKDSAETTLVTERKINRDTILTIQNMLEKVYETNSLDDYQSLKVKVEELGKILSEA